MSAMLAAGMLSAAIASASETFFSAPPIAMVRLLSMSVGSAAKASAGVKKFAATTLKTTSQRQRSENRRGVTLITSPLGCAGDRAGESR